MLEINEVSRHYGDFVAVDQLSLSVAEGTICGFLGPNGAGKTTTMKMICGLLKPTAGSIVVDGFNVVADPIQVKRRIGYVPDRPHLYEKLTALEYMYFIGGLYGIGRDEGQRARSAEERVAAHGRASGSRQAHDTGRAPCAAAGRGACWEPGALVDDCGARHSLHANAVGR